MCIYIYIYIYHAFMHMLMKFCIFFQICYCLFIYENTGIYLKCREWYFMTFCAHSNISMQIMASRLTSRRIKLGNILIPTICMILVYFYPSSTFSILMSYGMIIGHLHFVASMFRVIARCLGIEILTIKHML